eukprot:gnl/Dysnectes_brevis/9392_a17402_254.p1 GENE.gnl/Dysnectes_brevis/9392_a17402_254~~gnl/Dysnectes_brevis/9392_a17402_254.p1  ORF type:complete len:279 (+),score=-8.32 gnl/Dysnectes_brevis/9392_a17402_254:48-839(+)
MVLHDYLVPSDYVGIFLEFVSFCFSTQLIVIKKKLKNPIGNEILILASIGHVFRILWLLTYHLMNLYIALILNRVTTLLLFISFTRFASYCQKITSRSNDRCNLLSIISALLISISTIFLCFYAYFAVSEPEWAENAYKGGIIVVIISWLVVSIAVYFGGRSASTALLKADTLCVKSQSLTPLAHKLMFVSAVGVIAALLRSVGYFLYVMRGSDSSVGSWEDLFLFYLPDTAPSVGICWMLWPTDHLNSEEPVSPSRSYYVSI